MFKFAVNWPKEKPDIYLGEFHSKELERFKRANLSEFKGMHVSMYLRLDISHTC